MKHLFLNLKTGLNSIRRFKVRVALAISGVILGTLSVIMVMNLSQSLLKKTESDIAGLGKNLIIVRSGLTRSIRRSTLLSSSENLTMDDVFRLRNASYLIQSLVPATNKTLPVRYKDALLAETTVSGTENVFFSMRGFLVVKGRFFLAEEENNLEKVAILGNSVAEKLFQDQDPLSQYFFIDRIPFKVIGILEPKGADLTGFDQDSMIFVPIKTFLKRFINSKKINLIYIQAIDNKVIPTLKKQIQDLLRIWHHIKEGEEDDFTVIDIKELFQLESQTMKTVKTSGLIAASLAFVISALGIFSIMVLALSERKAEIGIRRAVGAKKKDIHYQFLWESSFIALTGGIIGLFLGTLFTVMLFKVTGYPMTFSLNGIIIAISASFGTGIVAGIYPAKRAANIKPIDILRA